MGCIKTIYGVHWCDNITFLDEDAAIDYAVEYYGEGLDKDQLWEMIDNTIWEEDVESLRGAA